MAKQEDDRLTKAIARRVGDLLSAVKPSEASLLEAGYTKATLNKLPTGKNLAQFVKLARLSRVLQSTPNQILGFDDTEIVIGIIEAVVLNLGYPAEEVQHFAEAAAKVINSRAVRSTHMPLRDTARNVAAGAIEGLSPPKRP